MKMDYEFWLTRLWNKLQVLNEITKFVVDVLTEAKKKICSC